MALVAGVMVPVYEPRFCPETPENERLPEQDSPSKPVMFCVWSPSVVIFCGLLMSSVYLNLIQSNSIFSLPSRNVWKLRSAPRLMSNLEATPFQGGDLECRHAKAPKQRMSKKKSHLKTLQLQLEKSWNFRQVDVLWHVKHPIVTLESLRALPSMASLWASDVSTRLWSTFLVRFLSSISKPETLSLRQFPSKSQANQSNGKQWKASSHQGQRKISSVSFTEFWATVTLCTFLRYWALQ